MQNLKRMMAIAKDCKILIITISQCERISFGQNGHVENHEKRVNLMPEEALQHCSLG
jgi:hypothetical protein